MKKKLYHLVALLLAVLLSAGAFLPAVAAEEAAPQGAVDPSGGSVSAGAPEADQGDADDAIPEGEVGASETEEPEGETPETEGETSETENETPEPENETPEGEGDISPGEADLLPPEPEAAAAAAPLAAPMAASSLQISVRVEYTDAFGGPYPADYLFHPDRAGGEIVINNPVLEPGARYCIWVTVAGYGETLGAEGPIDEIVNRGSFSVSGGSNDPNNPDGMLLLGFRVTVNGTGWLPNGDLDLYYKVSGRVMQPATQETPEERPFTYDPAALEPHQRPQIALNLENGTELTELGQVAPDGRFEAYLLKTALDALSPDSWVYFSLQSSYVTHESTPVQVFALTQEPPHMILLHGRGAGVLEGVITRGHLPADTAEDATSYVMIHLFREDEGSWAVTVGVSLNRVGDQISYRATGIAPGRYRVAFEHASTLWGAGTVFQYYDGKHPNQLEDADVITIRPFGDTVGVDTASWPGDRDHGGTGDVTAPLVTEVSPVSQEQEPDGALSVTFSEEVAADSPGVVRLVAAQGVEPVTLTGGTWSAGGTIYTAAYQGLVSGRFYQVEISGFADRAGNAMATDETYSLVAKGGELPRVFEHAASGIGLQGEFTPDAQLNVLEGLAAFKANAAAEAAAALQQTDEAHLLFVGDISVEKGRYKGPITLTIPVNPRFNGQSVLVLHCTGTALETIPAVVQDSKVTVTLSSLSPVAVVLGGNAPVLSNPSYKDLHAGGVTAVFDLDRAAHVYALTLPVTAPKPTPAEIKTRASVYVTMQPGANCPYGLAVTQPDREYIAYLVAESTAEANVFSGVMEIPFKALKRVAAGPVGGVVSPVVGAAPSGAIRGGTGYTASLSWNGSPAVFAADTPYTATVTLTAEEGYSFSNGYGTTEQIAAFTVHGIAPRFVKRENNYKTLVFTVTFPAARPLPAPSVNIQSIHNIRSNQAVMILFLSQPATVYWVALPANTPAPATAAEVKSAPGASSASKSSGFQSAELTNLEASTEYFVYMAAENAQGASEVAVSPFSTPAQQSADTTLLSVAGQAIAAFGGGDGSSPQQAKTASITVPYEKTAMVYGDDLVVAAGASGDAFESSDGGADGLGMKLAVGGGNYLSFVVIAQDGMAQCHYRIAILRQGPSDVPTITGPTSLALTAGYGATQTAAYTIGGSPEPTVAKTAGAPAVTWNDAAKRLEIAAGLGPGSYPVVLRATNRAGSATLTFTLTVNAAPAAVTGVTVNPQVVTVQKGTAYQFGATVKGTNNPGQAVTWSVTGNSSAATTIQGGLLTVGATESAATLTVRATSVEDTGKFGTATVAVSSGPPPAPTVSSVAVTPASITLAKGDRYVFSAVVTGAGSPSQRVQWTVTGGRPGTSISPQGVLQIAPGETAASLTVKAVSAIDTGKSGTALVAVAQPPTYTITLKANGGSVSPTSLETDASGKLASLPTPTRSGRYRFEGWFTAASGGTPVTPGTAFASHTTLYAHWSHTGSSGSSGGTGSSSGGGGSSSGGSGGTGSSSGGGGAAGGGGTIALGNGQVPLAPVLTVDPPRAKVALSEMEKANSTRARIAHAGMILTTGEAWAAFGQTPVDFDTVLNGAVQVRVSVPAPGNLTTDTYVSGFVSGSPVDSTRKLFETWFGNKIRVLHFDSAAPWGQAVGVAAKIDLAGMDTANLYFYSYDKSGNTYRRLENPACRVDGNGYLRFTTRLAGEIVISEGPLARK